MKKRVFFIGGIVWIVIAIAAVALLVAGLTGKLSIGGTDMFNLDGSQLVKEERFSAGGIDTLDVSVSYHSLRVTLVDDSEITVRQYDRDSQNLFTSRTDGGSLSIAIAPRNITSLFGINIDPRLEIDLPRSYANDISLKTSSGTVRIREYMKCGALDVTTSSGSVSLGDLELSSLSVSTSSGTQRLGSIYSSGKVLLKSSSGSISCDTVTASGCEVKTNSGTQRLGDIGANGTLTLESTSGSITTGSLRAQDVSIKSNSGTLHHDNITAAGRLDISSSSGSQTADDVEAGTFDIGANSGTLNYGGISGAGSVETTSGSIRCGSLDVRGDVSVTSSSGTQRLTLADSPSFEIKISSSSGTIRTGDLDIYYSNKNGKSAFGTVGSGANGTLSIKSSSGSVTIN